jgi:hypothetical protein
MWHEASRRPAGTARNSAGKKPSRPREAHMMGVEKKRKTAGRRWMTCMVPLLAAAAASRHDRRASRLCKCSRRKRRGKGTSGQQHSRQRRLCLHCMFDWEAVTDSPGKRIVESRRPAGISTTSSAARVSYVGEVTSVCPVGHTASCDDCGRVW